MARILLVDDDPSVVSLYRLELEDDGYEVRTAGDSREAARLVDEWRPACAIIDVKLGDENGLDLLRSVLAKAPDLRTILLSAYPGYKDDFTSWLADAFVTKQSDTSELKRKVHELLGSEAIH